MEAKLEKLAHDRGFHLFPAFRPKPVPSPSNSTPANAGSPQSSISPDLLARLSRRAFYKYDRPGAKANLKDAHREPTDKKVQEQLEAVRMVRSASAPKLPPASTSFAPPPAPSPILPDPAPPSPTLPAVRLSHSTSASVIGTQHIRNRLSAQIIELDQRLFAHAAREREQNRNKLKDPREKRRRINPAARAIAEEKQRQAAMKLMEARNLFDQVHYWL